MLLSVKFVHNVQQKLYLQNVLTTLLLNAQVFHV